MTSNKKIVIVGATSGIAEQCVRLWALQNPSEIILIGRNLEKLQRLETDLAVRTQKTKIVILQTDFMNPRAVQSVVDQVCQAGAVDIALIAHGTLPIQEECQNDLESAQDALNINGLSPVFFAEAFAGNMQKQNAGTLAIIGSVAGDRGRRSNYVYGAAKGLVTRYAQGLQHRLAKTKVKVVLIKPGPTDTPMTAQLKQTGAKLASSVDVAKEIIVGIEQGRRVVYTPKPWLFIMLIIRHLPFFVFKRMDI